MVVHVLAVMVWFGPPLMVYVITYGAVPLRPQKVTSGPKFVFWHTAPPPVTVASGNGHTVTVTQPLAGWLQLFASVTLTRQYSKVPTTLVGAHMLILGAMDVLLAGGNPLIV